MEQQTERIRVRILIPVACALTVMLVVAAFSIYRFQQRKIAEDIRHEIEEVQELLPRFLELETDVMETILDFIKDDTHLQQAWFAKDRQALLKHTTPFFQDIRAAANVTHFYFIDLDGLCFLRVHKPASYGDIIDRFTLDQAVRQGQQAYGIELGPYGTFTLRVVRPWRIGDQLVGYIELGKEIDHIAPVIHDILGVELFFAIDKSFLERAKWEEGMKIMGHIGNWERFPDVVVAYQSLEEAPAELFASRIDFRERRSRLNFKSKILGRTYCGGFIPLLDVGKRNVGDILVLNDITDDEKTAIMTMGVQVAICTFMGFLLFLFFYTYIGRIEQRLVTTHNDLRAEIADHTKTEEELRNYRDHLQELVDQKTAEVTTSNQKLVQEITTRKQAQEELQSLNENLEKLVDERTRELIAANEALFRKEKLAILGKLAGGLGHELRKPLAVIKNAAYFLDMKLKTKGDAAVKDNIASINQEIENSVKIISDMLDFSKVRKPDRQDVDINHLVAETLLRVTINGNIKVNTNFADDMDLVSLDPTQVGQILTNLIDNAAQAMPDGGTLMIRTKQSTGVTEVVFIDEGCGIPKENLDNIFEPLVTSKDQGIGLGLVVCKTLAEANGGTLTVESTEGKGSIFTITFSD